MEEGREDALPCDAATQQKQSHGEQQRSSGEAFLRIVEQQIRFLPEEVGVTPGKLASIVLRTATALHSASGPNARELEDNQDVDGRAYPRADTATQGVRCRCQMQQRQERARPSGGAGQIDLRHDEQGDEKRQRFFRTARVELKHRSSFQEREAQPPLRRADQ